MKLCGRIFGNAIAFFLLLLSTVLVLSCSSGNPEIRSTRVQVLRVEGSNGAFAERLSVFVFFDDTDGPADFGSIIVTHDDSGLTWTISPDEVMVRLRGKDRWAGSNALAGPADEPLPKGEYTIAVADLAGNEALAKFTLPTPNFPTRSPYRLSISRSQWKLERNPDAEDFGTVWFLLFDGDDRLVNSWKVPDAAKTAQEGPIQTLTAVAPSAVTAQCYIENKAGTAGVLLTPLSLR